MDEKLNKSLIAFRNVINRIDKNKLKEIVDKIDKLESNLKGESIINYQEEIQNQFVFFYDFTNEAIEENIIFNEENFIENNISTMQYKSLDNKPRFNIYLDGIIVESILEANYLGEANEALAA
jgi:hypothetical protein